MAGIQTQKTVQTQTGGLMNTKTSTRVSPLCWQPKCLFPGCQRSRPCSRSEESARKRTFFSFSVTTTHQAHLASNGIRSFRKDQVTSGLNQTHTCICTLAGPLNWLFLPLLPEREPDPGLEPELGREPVLPLLLCSHSSCAYEERMQFIFTINHSKKPHLKPTNVMCGPPSC